MKDADFFETSEIPFGQIQALLNVLNNCLWSGTHVQLLHTLFGLTIHLC